MFRRSLHRDVEAALDGQDRSGDVFGLLRDQEGDGVGYILRVADMAQRDARVLEGAVGEVAVTDRGSHHAGADCVHPDVERRQIDCRAEGEGVDASFRDRVGELIPDTGSIAAMPQLAGKLVGAKPACRPRELLVAITQPGVAEIQIKLDKTLSGKPEPSAEFRWEGVPSAFTAEPFLLTMDADAAKIDGLALGPCAVGRK